MSKLKVIRGAVLEAQHSTINEVSQIGSGDTSTVSSRPVSHALLWVSVGDKAIPIKLDGFELPFRVGQQGAFVLRGNQTIFALNETTTQWSAIRARMVPWAETAGFWALITFVVGLFALLPLGGGAPIGPFVTACLLSPFPVGVLIWRARKRTYAECRELLGLRQN